MREWLDLATEFVDAAMLPMFAVMFLVIGAHIAGAWARSRSLGSEAARAILVVFFGEFIVIAIALSWRYGLRHGWVAAGDAFFLANAGILVGRSVIAAGQLCALRAFAQDRIRRRAWLVLLAAAVFAILAVST